MMKQQDTSKYKYIHPDPAGNPEEKFLVCPNCGETLLPADIESFSTCPYCNTKLEFSNDLEDFILSPLISHWIQAVRNRQESGRESRYRL